MDKCGPGWCAGAPPSAINQRVARTIVSCRDVRHYEVHSEAQLSYKASNRSKSILFRQRRCRWTVYPYSCFRVNAELTLRKQPIFTGNVFFWSFSQDCKCAFVWPSCACSYIFNSLLKGYLTKLLRVKHKDDLSSWCSNEVRMAFHENDSSQSEMWKAVMATNAYDIVKISAHCHTPLCEWAAFSNLHNRSGLFMGAKNCMQRSTAVAMATRAKKTTEGRA